MSIPKKFKFYLADTRPGRFVLVDQVEGSKPKPWAQHKTFSDHLSASYKRLAYEKPEFYKNYEAVANCGNWLKFSECSSGCVEGKSLIGASFCRQRLCPMCQWRRSLLVASQVSQVAAKADHYHSVRFLFLTLTLRNCPGDALADQITHLTNSLRKLLNYKEIKSQILGTFRGLEVTVKKDAALNYHPHLHVLLAVRPSYFTRGYIPIETWVQYWQKAAKVPYVPICDIRKVTPSKSGGYAGAAAESAKYSVKPGDIIDLEDLPGTDQRLEILHTSLKGRRSYAYTGLLKQIHNELFKRDPESEEDNLLDDPLERCSCPKCGTDLAERVFHWAADRNLYISNQSTDRQHFHDRIDQAAGSWRQGKRGI